MAKNRFATFTLTLSLFADIAEDKSKTNMSVFYRTAPIPDIAKYTKQYICRKRIAVIGILRFALIKPIL